MRNSSRAWWSAGWATSRQPFELSNLSRARLIASSRQSPASASDFAVPREVQRRFLHRNRIIAALGAGTVIVEAARRSGSLVTARLAAELGRVVMALPGPVTSELSVGTHELIRDGAILVTQASQVREACASLAAASGEPRVATACGQQPDERPRGRQRRRTRPVPGTEPADPIEELVLEALPNAADGVGAEVFALARATGIGPDAVFAALGRLAAVGRAVKAGGGWMLSTTG